MDADTDVDVDVDVDTGTGTGYRVRAVRSACGPALMGPKQAVIHVDERHSKHYSAHGVVCEVFSGNQPWVSAEIRRFVCIIDRWNSCAPADVAEEGRRGENRVSPGTNANIT